VRELAVFAVQGVSQLLADGFGTVASNETRADGSLIGALKEPGSK